jgi:hypothetical protein
MDRRWRIAHRRLAHCRRSPHIISGTNIPLALHMGTNKRNAPTRYYPKGKHIPAVIDFWRSATLLANRCKTMLQFVRLLEWLLLFLCSHSFRLFCAFFSFLSPSFWYFYSFIFIVLPLFFSILCQFSCLDLSLFHALFIQAHELFILTSLSLLPPHMYDQIKHFLFCCYVMRTMCNCTASLVIGKVTVLMRIPRAIG